MNGVKLDEWIAYSVTQKWVVPSVCSAHEKLPLTVPEQEFDEDDDEDACIHVLRLCVDEAEHAAVLANA